MKFTILHLSDVHIKEKENDNHVLQKTSVIFDAVKNKMLDSQVIFIILTGDIAFSGKKEEYVHAKRFINELKNSISEYTKKDCEVIVIPGNHDCLLEKDSVRDAIIKSLETDGFYSLDEKQLDICCSPQTNYRAFEEEITSSGFTRIHHEKLISIFDYKCGDENVTFNCFNTSWISKLHETPGRMVYPSNYIDEHIYNNTSSLTLNLIHHPINWQSPMASREFKKTLEVVGDIVMSGHEHEKDEYVKYNLDGKFTGYIEAPALQESENRNVSGFSLINFEINQGRGRYSILRFKFNHVSNSYSIVSESPVVEFKSRNRRGSNSIFLEPNFSRELDNPGAQFLHSQVDKIYLSDIMVYPELKFLNTDYDTKESINKIVNSAALFELPSETKEKIRITLIGGDYSGKSTLCKKLFSFFYEGGYTPVYLKGSDIKELNKDKFRKDLKDIFNKQYDSKYGDRFDSLDNKQLVLIIDDFHTCSIKNEYRVNLVQRLKEVYSHIIFTGNAIVHFEPFIGSSHEKQDIFADFQQYLILELGAQGRNKLISQWVRLGRESFLERSELQRKIDSTERQIDSVLGKGFIPSYPIFVLTLLQSIESGNSNPEYSLYGHYYEYLINDSIIKNIKDKGYHQFYHQLLTEFCYFLFEHKLKEISLEDFKRYAVNHQQGYTTNLSFDKVFDNLIKAKFLNLRDGHVSIAYKYIYYYYVAKNLADNISDGIVRQMISKMCKRLHREEFANILMFLTHLSKDAIILNEIHATANELLSDISASKLEDDIDFINELIDDVPALVLETTDVEKMREEDIGERDVQERIEREFDTIKKSNSYDLDEDLNSIDTLNLFLKSIKTFELLGQITKKYWGSVKGDKKLEYAESTFGLALRTLNFYFKCINENREGVVEWIRLLVDKKKLKDSLKIKEFSKKFIFHLSYVAAFSIIRRTSNSIGHIELDETFKALIEKNPTNSNKLIDLSIKLDFYNSFPYRDLEALIEEKQIKKNYLAKHLIQNLVYNYLRLYDESHENRQRICNLVGIDIKKQLVAYESSQEKKD